MFFFQPLATTICWSTLMITCLVVTEQREGLFSKAKILFFYASIKNLWNFRKMRVGSFLWSRQLISLTWHQATFLPRWGSLCLILLTFHFTVMERNSSWLWYFLLTDQISVFPDIRWLLSLPPSYSDEEIAVRSQRDSSSSPTGSKSKALMYCFVCFLLFASFW